MRENILWLLIGALIILTFPSLPVLRTSGLEALGAILGIIFIVCSLFGDLPSWISWAQKLGEKLGNGIALGTLLLLIPFIVPTSLHESSFFAISPTVWAAYICIILVGISFENSTLPINIYSMCKRSNIKPFLFVPLYIVVAGLLGNILDGVSIVIISTVIFLHLLAPKWVIRAMFALLFGGLISNLITVAAEPTNIKFQDILGPLLNQMHPSFWVTNWPVCVMGIIFPALFLGLWMKKEQIMWKEGEPEKIAIFHRSFKDPMYIDSVLSAIAVTCLALGIIIHAVLETIPAYQGFPLWLLLLPAGLAALNHLFVGERITETFEHIEEQSPVWLKLIIIFSLLWYLQHGLTATRSFLNLFLLLPNTLQYYLLVLLSLASAATDNVALAAIQGTIILGHPIAFWKIRLLLILLTWAGGLTPFGCLQSLSINHRLNLSTGQWIKEAPLWATLAITGGLVGFGLIALLYPTTVGLP